jgi:hypothetical protein
MAFEFLNDLTEARMTRNSNNQRMLTYTDCKERAYLIILMMQVMRHYRSYRDTVGHYAHKTVMYREYNRLRVDGSDLYNLFYFITGDRDALNKLKDPGSAEVERRRVLISVGNLNGYLRRMKRMDKPSSADDKDLFQLERELGIVNPDYKTLRRRISSYSTDSAKERQTTITRLLFAGRAKLSDSDFLHLFSKLALDKNLEDFTKTDPEFDPSTPDSVTQTDVINYRLLVNVSRLPYIAKFIENARAGRAVVAQFVQAYAPLIIMLDDIVKAGPTYINQLKILHERAKKARK